MRSRTEQSPVMSPPERPRARGAGRQARASDDDCAGAAEAGGGRKCAENRSHPGRADRGKRETGRGSHSRRARHGGRCLEEASECPRVKLASRERAIAENLLNDDRRGDRAEHDPKCDDGNADGRLQRIRGSRRVKEARRRVGHEIEDSLGDERCDSPVKRLDQHAHNVHQVTAATERSGRIAMKPISKDEIAQAVNRMNF
mgnify:CR=1 FL=1